MFDRHNSKTITLHWGPGIHTCTVPGPLYMIHQPYWFTIRTDSLIRTLKVQISESTSVSVVRILGPQCICLFFWPDGNINHWVPLRTSISPAHRLQRTSEYEMVDNGSSIKIKKDGLYLIYAQVKEFPFFQFLMDFKSAAFLWEVG